MNRSAAEVETFALEVARQIKRLRESRELSQRDLARASGLSRNTVSLLERGRTSPTLATLQRIADALDVDIRSFFQTALRPGGGAFHPGVDQPVARPTSAQAPLDGCRLDRLVSAQVLRLAPGSDSGPLPEHPGGEYIHCLSGRLVVCVEDQVHLLERGKNLLVDGRSVHACQNAGSDPAEALIILLDLIG